MKLFARQNFFYALAQGWASFCIAGPNSIDWIIGREPNLRLFTEYRIVFLTRTLPRFS